MLRKLIKTTINRLGFELTALPKTNIAYKGLADNEFYRPVFSPWLGYGEFKVHYEKIRSVSLVSADRCWVLYCLARQAIALEGEFWECGVFKGGTAAMLAELIDRAALPAGKTLRLFDTFAGMPVTDWSRDFHNQGDFSDTNLAAVKIVVGNRPFVEYEPGFIPQTFAGQESTRVAFAHVDVDIYRSVMDCCSFIFPRLVDGGFMIFDDYGFPSCPGARQAVDEYFVGKSVIPLCLPTGQAIVFKSPGQVKNTIGAEIL